MSISGIHFWNFLVHNHKAIDPFSNFFDWLQNFKLFQIPDFLVESFLQMNRNSHRCMSCEFDIWFELELVWFSGKFTNSCENVRVHFKNSLLCQWLFSNFIHPDADLVELVHHFCNEQMIYLAFWIGPGVLQAVWVPLLDFLGTCWNFL